jgi:signal peptidase I
MPKVVTTFLISLITPGLGYLQIGDRNNFFRAFFLFFTTLILGVVFRLLTSFNGLLTVSIALLFIYLFAIVHATIKARFAPTPKTHITASLKLFYTIAFILISGLSFANKRTVMGIDILSMNVPVMQPAVLPGDKFIVNAWAYLNDDPQRGDIVVHSFDGQPGLYLNRIIAKEGDRIEIKEGIVFINGQQQNEPYVLSANATRPESRNMKELIVPKEYYFVMGDNRDASFGDSRFNGSIASENIEGKITDIISSSDRRRIGNTVK